MESSGSTHWMRKQLQMLSQDSLHALRMMLRDPGFSLLAIVTLALGVGVNTAIFSVVQGILLRPLPYTQPKQIVILRQQAPQAGVSDMAFSVPDIADYRQQNTTLSSLVEYHTMRFLLLDHGSANRVRTGVVSSNFFDFFGIKPVLGRAFAPGDERPGAPAVALLSYEYWKSVFQGDPNVVGRTFEMNDKLHSVIGVLPKVPQYPSENDIYVTTSTCPFRSAPAFIASRDQRLMSVFGRVKPGVTLAEVNSNLALIARRLQLQYPDAYPPGFTSLALSLSDELTRKARPTLWILTAAGLFVLLIACANVTNFTLARMAQREQELLIRSAMGAGKNRLRRQLITESTIAGLFAAILGLLLALASQKLLIGYVSRLTPRATEISIDGWVLAFGIFIALATSIAAGSSLAFSSRVDLASGLRQGTRQSTMRAGRKHTQGLLITGQVAFSLMLLVGAGLMIRSFEKLQNVDLGFAPQNVLTMAIDLNWSKYASGEQRRSAASELLSKVQQVPHVENAAVSSSFPLDPDGIARGASAFDNRFQIEGRPVRPGEAAVVGAARAVSPDYFKVLSIPLLKGRFISQADREGAPQVAVVSYALARHRWPNEDPLGKRISFDDGMNWITIVGIVGDTKEFSIDHPAVDEIYLPIDQVPGLGSLIVKTTSDPLALANQIRHAVSDFDLQTAVTNLKTLDQARADTLTSPRVLKNLLSLFAVLALIIAATGIGGILTLAVSQQTKEIGIRVALGAERGAIVNMVLFQGMTSVVIGLVIGLAGSLLMTNPIRAFLFNVAPYDPLTLAVVCLLLLVIAFVACYIPARRTTRVNPVTALRHE